VFLREEQQMTNSSKRARVGGTGLLLAAALAMTMASVAEARPGRSGGLGSRGSRTFDAPASTNTAPGPGAPINRTITQPGAGQVAPGGAVRPGAPVAGQAAAPSFGRSLMGGIAGGLLGAGLFGLLSGSGLFGGLSGIAGFLGLLLQIGLVVLVVRFAMRWFRSRQGQAAPAAGPMQRDMMGGQPPQNAQANGGGLNPGLRSGLGSLGGLGAGAAAARPARQSRGGDEVGIGQGDFDAFERTLVEVQDAYGREDVGRLRGLTTPEMASYFEGEIADNVEKGLVNRVSGAALLQGDLAESWREPDAQYATVAMRYSLLDVTLERASGRVVDGDANQPQEVTELWTFRREPGQGWRLSAIQQAA